MSPYTIKPLTLKDASISAKLHLEGMPKDFLPSFGMKFLKILHEAIIDSSDVISHGYFKYNILVGILFASKNTRNIFLQILSTRLFKLLPFIIIRTLLFPATSIKLLQTIAYGLATPRTIPAEILILSVDHKFKRQGIASKLFTKLTQVYTQKQIKKFLVGTTSGNKEANAFYLKMGGKFIKNLKIYNRIWNMYSFDITKNQN